MADVKLEPTTGESGPVLVQALSRGLGILGQFTVDEPALSLTDLSRKTGLHRATIYRFVKTLESNGCLAYDSDKAAYTIGQAWAAALHSLGGSGALIEILTRDLSALAEATGETAAIAIRKGQGVQVINVAPTLSLFTPRLPPSALVSLSEDWSVHVRLHLAFSHRGNGRPGTAALEERVAVAAAEGIAYSREDYRKGICAIAVPIFSRDRLAATLGLVVPVERFGESEVERFARELRVAAAEMGRRLDDESRGTTTRGDDGKSAQ